MYNHWRIEVWERANPAEPAVLDYVRVFPKEEEAIAFKTKINENIDPKEWHVFATGPFLRSLEYIQ